MFLQIESPERNSKKTIEIESVTIGMYKSKQYDLIFKEIELSDNTCPVAYVSIDDCGSDYEPAITAQVIEKDTGEFRIHLIPFNHTVYLLSDNGQTIDKWVERKMEVMP